MMVDRRWSYRTCQKRIYVVALMLKWGLLSWLMKHVEFAVLRYQLEGGWKSCQYFNVLRYFIEGTYAISILAIIHFSFQNHNQIDIPLGVYVPWFHLQLLSPPNPYTPNQMYNHTAGASTTQPPLSTVPETPKPLIPGTANQKEHATCVICIKLLHMYLYNKEELCI